MANATDRPGLRGWHAWLGAALTLPIVVVSLTAIFIAHDKSLGLKDILVPSGWLPGYSMAAAQMHLPEVRTIQRHADGRDYVATNHGLFVRDGDRLSRVGGLERIEVRGLATAGDVLLAGAKNGVWAGRNGRWGASTRARRGRSASRRAAPGRRRSRT